MDIGRHLKESSAPGFVRILRDGAGRNARLVLGLATILGGLGVIGRAFFHAEGPLACSGVGASARPDKTFQHPLQSSQPILFPIPILIPILIPIPFSIAESGGRTWRLRDTLLLARVISTTAPTTPSPIVACNLNNTAASSQQSKSSPRQAQSKDDDVDLACWQQLASQRSKGQRSCRLFAPLGDEEAWKSNV